jgi:hypothetical protein
MGREARMQPSEVVALGQGSRSGEVPKESLLRWLGVNVMRLTLYLALVSFVVATATLLTGDALFGDDPFEEAAVLFLAGLVGIPGTCVWLLLVAMMPPGWSTIRRYALAVAMSPIIQIVWLMAFISWGAYELAIVFAVLLPAGSAFVVRFRELRPSSLFPPGE